MFIAKILSLAAGSGTVLVMSNAVGLMAVETQSWRAIGELGLSIVLAAVAFFGLVWWFKETAKNQREDIKAHSARIDKLDDYIHTELLAATKASTHAIEMDTVKTKANTAQLDRVVRALSQLVQRLECRPCQVLTMLPDADRATVMGIIQRSVAAEERIRRGEEHNEPES